MNHAQLITAAERWLRSYRCTIVLSEQTADSGEVPDVMGWRSNCHSIVIECKVSRADFLVDKKKPVRQKPELGMGCERFYLTPKSLLKDSDLPQGWGLLEVQKREIVMRVKASRRSQRTITGLMAEMELLLASLRRVEVRIEPQTITEFLKWKNRMAAYNGGRLPQGLVPLEQELLPGV